TPEAVRKIIVKEAQLGPRIDALLPTLGGQTALNCACKLWDDGTLQEFGIEMIGADRKVIHRAEDRQVFKDIVESLGLKVPAAKTVTTLEDAREFLKEIGLPAIIRPAFTLGGSGGGIAYNTEEFDEIVSRGLRMSMIGQVQVDKSVLGWKEFELEVVRDKKDNCIIVCGIELSPVSEVLIEESLLGWKEYEMEVMRDKADNCVIICSIENFDPMGVHTGDSITVAPIQTLTDKEYQLMRDQSFAVIRAVGVETGGSNIQFGCDPVSGRMVIIEMNPRVSRSSALASKATGFPIAKIAAKLAVGYLLDELRNDITRETPASFEPSIDYVVTKIPRFAFEKFPQADPTLTTQMKSVGEAMAIGRTFKESLQKCLRSLEIGRSGLGGDGKAWRIGTEVYGDRDILPRDLISRKLSAPNAERIFFIRHALRAGYTIEDIFNLTKIDRWFLVQIKELVDFEEELAAAKN
ncbi:MAG TPA: carbamoyl-phosphate synthase subunit L, partial [Candidatus Limnocylindria bacterium]|nr:carbamoyl-phosphate synthase subunit L [Candidatus Limnocylindria bacterium]